MNAVNFKKPQFSPVPGWVLFLAGCVALGASIHHRIEKQAVSLSREKSVKAVEGDKALAPKRPVPLEPDSPSMKARIQALSELQRPWMAMFESLESVATEPVYLLTLELEPGKDAIHLTAETGSFNEILVLVRKLQKIDTIRSAVITSHSATEPKPGEQTGIRFRIAAHWPKS